MSPPAIAVLCALLSLAIGCASEPPRSGGSRTVLMGEGSSPPAPRRPRVLGTVQDDARVGAEASEAVAAELGLLDAPELQAYVSELGSRLSRQLPARKFDYRFAIVDQFEPNAFALPGGYVYVSRGLLALANTEDELANVLGHEITHAAERHQAAQQNVARHQNPFLMPYVRMANLAAYGRDLERAADVGGQTLAARAGYDPMGMADFLSNLGNVEKLRRGHSRLPSFFDTHPGTTERAATCAARAPHLRVAESQDVSHERSDYLRHVDGILLGTNPAEGVFQGARFLHPDLDFHVRFPSGWRYRNTHRAVGAQSPEGEALVFLTAEKGDGDARRAAEVLVARHADEYRVRVRSARDVRIGAIEAHRLEVTAVVQGQPVAGELTFIPYRGLMYRVVGVAPRQAAGDFEAFARSTARSFRPLTSEERESVEELRLRTVRAREGEDLAALGERTGNRWDPLRTAVLNGVVTNARFREGTQVKIVRGQPYRTDSASAASRSSGFGDQGSPQP